MKQIIFLGLIAVATMIFSSCDTKECKCYVYDGVHAPYMESQYVSYDNSCSVRDYRNGTQYRYCLEMDEPDINPGEIGQEYKKNL